MSDDDLAHYMKATSRLRATVAGVQQAMNTELDGDELVRLVGKEVDSRERLVAENERLRAVVEAAAAEASALAGGPHVERAAALASHLRVALGQRGATLSDDRLSQTAAHLHTENEHLAAENERLRAVVERALRELPVPPYYGPGSVWDETRPAPPRRTTMSDTIPGPDCDICLAPCDPTLMMTLAARDTTTEVAACWDCSVALLAWMTDRWRGSIAAHNEAVNEMLRMFGIDVVASDHADDSYIQLYSEAADELAATLDQPEPT